MKKILVLLFLAVILAVALTCKYVTFDEREYVVGISSVEHDDADRIADCSLGKTSFSIFSKYTDLVIRNDSDVPVYFIENMITEYRIDGEWYVQDPAAYFFPDTDSGVGTAAAEYAETEILPGESLRMDFCASAYPKYKAGDYRCILTVRSDESPELVPHMVYYSLH